MPDSIHDSKVRIAEAICSMLSKVLSSLIQWGGIALSVYLSNNIFFHISGKMTVFSADINFHSGISKIVFCASVLSLIAVIFIQRKHIARIKNDHQKSMDDCNRRIRNLEQKLDQKRSSSNRMKQGGK